MMLALDPGIEKFHVLDKFAFLQRKQVHSFRFRRLISSWQKTPMPKFAWHVNSSLLGWSNLTMACPNKITIVFLHCAWSNA